MTEYSQPCVICGKTLAQHGTGAGLPVCVGIAVPTYRPTTAQAEAEALKQRIAELEAENARLRETLGTICKDSNPDWTEKRAYPECVLDDIHEMAVKAYYELKS